MTIDLWQLYEKMYVARLYEDTLAQLYREGLISGEYHSSAGEEAINAGVIAHLVEGDAIALDHRGTAPLLMRGLDPLPLIREIMGHPEGLCQGMSGHMHLFSKEYLAASSGIVGASGPGAVGFALAAQMLRPGTVCVAFFGEGALNQGMLMEAFNLAMVWELPILFVCKDDNWAITTKTNTTSAVDPDERAQGFGLPVYKVDGNDVEAVYKVVEKSLRNVRKGKGPAFIHAICSHFEGHMIDLQLVRVGRKPLEEIPEIAKPLIESALKLKGASVFTRVKGMLATTTMILGSAKDHRANADDPIRLARKKLAHHLERLENLEEQVSGEVEGVLKVVLNGTDQGGEG